MNSSGIISSDSLMIEIVRALRDEVQNGDVYPLMATASSKTCDHKCSNGGDYPCVNIKVENEIYAIDIYPSGLNNSVVFSLFRRIGKKSLYKMTDGFKGDDKDVIEIITNGRLNGFIKSGNDYQRREWVFDLDKSQDLHNEPITDVKSAKVIKVLRKVIKAVRKVYFGG